MKTVSFCVSINLTKTYHNMIYLSIPFVCASTYFFLYLLSVSNPRISARLRIRKRRVDFMGIRCGT